MGTLGCLVPGSLVSAIREGDRIEALGKLCDTDPDPVLASWTRRGFYNCHNVLPDSSGWKGQVRPRSGHHLAGRICFLTQLNDRCAGPREEFVWNRREHYAEP